MDLIEAYKLVEEEKLEEAYDAFTSLLDDKKQGIDARYSRSMIDISRLKTHLDDTIDDLKYFIDKKTKYKQIAYTFLALVYDELDNIKESIYYSRLALKNNSPFPSEVMFTLARALAREGKNGDLTEALELINKCLLDEENDNTLDYLVCKCDILTSLQKFTDAKEVTNKILTDFGYSGIYYYLKARISLKEYNKTENKCLLKDAINDATICLQYEENDFATKTILIEAYTHSEEFDKAIETIDSLKDEVSLEDFTMEKLKVYETKKDYDTGLNLIEEFLKIEESWKMYYMKGYLLYNKDKANIKEMLINYKKAYSLFPSSGILLDILNINTLLKDEQDSYDFLKNNLNNKEELGFIYFLLAEVSYKLNKSYDETRNNYYLAYRYGYLSESEYLDSVCNYTENRKELNKVLKKKEKEAIKANFAWTRRKLAIRYLYAEDGYKQNLKKARTIIESCLKDFKEDPCTLSLHGICMHHQKEDLLAYKQIKKSYELIKTIENPECYCSYGYYAYFNIEGFGTTKDINLAKEIILEAIKKEPVYTCSHIAYLYTYFYLTNDEKFNKDVALNLLENNYPYYRYDISRIVLLSQLTKKLNIKSNKLNELLKDINKYSKEEIKYFNENINKEYSLPYWKNI